MTQAFICDAVRTFPSTTAALRFRPRSFARFMGEPLNATENSSGAIASRARASWRVSLPASTSRGANAGARFLINTEKVTAGRAFQIARR